MQSYLSRLGNKWTINECLQLHREYELLQLSMDEIAEIHKRSPRAIMYKLDAEGIADYITLYNDYNKSSPQHNKDN